MILKGIFFILYMICITFFVRALFEHSYSAIIWIILAICNLLKFIKIKNNGN